ncbi:MAG: hypothetical protein HQM09_20035 [Candidatus Riflebacteria bacterium]|nr:hypothetical protein [Candidatus Riflebacteria bacterium]
MSDKVGLNSTADKFETPQSDRLEKSVATDSMKIHEKHMSDARVVTSSPVLLSVKIALKPEIGSDAAKTASATLFGFGAASEPSDIPVTFVEGAKQESDKLFDKATQDVLQKGRLLFEAKKWDELGSLLEAQKKLPAIVEVMEWRIEFMLHQNRINFISLKNLAEEVIGKDSGNITANFGLAFYWANNPKNSNNDKALKYLEPVVRMKKSHEGADQLYWTLQAKKRWQICLVLLCGFIMGLDAIRKKRAKNAVTVTKT